MPHEHTVRAVDKVRRPILLAVSVVAVILVAATAYSFVRSLPPTVTPSAGLLAEDR